LSIIAAGVLILVAAWIPAYLHKRPLSLPMVLITIGAMLFAVVPGLPDVNPREHLSIAEHLTEIGVLISLLGAGISIDRAPGWRRWATTSRLLSVGMTLTIVLATFVGWSLIGLPIASALLFGSIIAPTDPVLAADVQVGEPTVDGARTDGEDQVRFSLTSEAGLNDALAFPFVMLAIAIVGRSGNSDGWLVDWLISDVLIRLGVGVIAGWVAGRVLARLMFNPPSPLSAIAETTEGFVALGAILLVYGLTEAAHGYGFLAVFVAAVTLRDSQRGHPYHKTLHQFTAQIEQLLTVGLLVLLGGAVATGALGQLTVRSALAGAAVIFVIRPAAARLALLKTRTTPVERRAIEFFGIRGIGSLYYLAYASSKAEFVGSGELWSATVFTVVLSIFVHGVAATPVMRVVDQRRVRRHATRTAAGLPVSQAG
jgi:sodium/hydrogen antiporter